MRPLCHPRFQPDNALLGKGADYDIVLAARLGDLATVSTLLTEDPALANFADTRHERPISPAVWREDLPMVKVPLEHGADPSLAEHGAPHGQALWWAARRGNLAITKMLLEHGADPSAEVESAGSVLFAAGDNQEISRAGHRNVVELLLKRGADPSKAGAAWSTPLAWAEKYDRVEIAALLQASIRQRE